MDRDRENFNAEENSLDDSRYAREIRRALLKQAKDIQSIKWYLRFFVIMTVIGVVGVLSAILAIVYQFMRP